jgi:hypothetical protein
MKKYIALIVLVGALVGLVWQIERTARPVNERQPGAAASAETPAAPGAPGMPGAPGPEPGHEGHAHGPGDGHNH